MRWAVAKVFGADRVRLSGCGDGTRSVRVGSGLSPVPLECSRTGPLRFLAGGGPVCWVVAVGERTRTHAVRPHRQKGCPLGAHHATPSL